MKLLNPFALKNHLASSTITTFGIFGWLLLLEIAIPTKSIEKLKENLRQRDDQRHGEIWDLHFCAEGNPWELSAQISYPESTIVFHRSYTRTDGTVQHDSTMKFSPGRGTIMDGASGNMYSPPGNTSGNIGVEGFCSGRVYARGYFPDSLKIQVQSKGESLPLHWITGIKELAPKKVTTSNRTRITIIYQGQNKFKTIVTERPRIDRYSCSSYGDSCQEETWRELFWKAYAP